MYEGNRTLTGLGRFDDFRGSSSVLGLAMDAPMETLRASAPPRLPKPVATPLPKPVETPPPPLVVGAKTFEEAWKEAFPTIPQNQGLLVGAKTFEETIWDLMVLIIHFIALGLWYNPEGANLEDEEAIVSAMEIDLLLYTTTENVGVVIATMNALGEEYEEGTPESFAWKRVGKKLVERCCGRHRLIDTMISLESTIERDADGSWIHISHASARRADATGTWETRYVIASKTTPKHTVVLVPVPLCRPALWSRNGDEQWSVVLCPSIPVSAKLGSAGFTHPVR